MEVLTESDKVDKLYSYYGLLADCDANEMNQRETVYKEIIRAVNGCNKEKRLACQFIPVFFKHFPNLADLAIEALLDLCEDSDAVIRRQAIKELPVLCRDSPKHTKKIAMILSQLLSIKNPSELRIVHEALLSLFKIDAKVTIIAICHQIKNSDYFLRNSCLRFLALKMNDIARAIKAAEAEEGFISELKIILSKACLEEIPLLIKIMLAIDRYHSLQGRHELADIIAVQVEAFSPFEPKNEEKLERLIVFLKHFHLVQSGNKSVHSNRFVLYICEEVLPHFSSISGCEEGVGFALEILQLLAELTSCSCNIIDCELAIKSLFNILYDFIPLTDNAKAYEGRIHYSYIECLLYTLHKLTNSNPSLLTKDPYKLKNFRARLRHFSCNVQGYYNALEAHLNVCFSDTTSEVPHEHGVKRRWVQAVKYATEHGCKDPILNMIEARQLIKLKNSSEADSSEYKQDYEKIKLMSEIKKNFLRAMAFDTLTSILVLIKDFFKNPPLCEASVELSFGPLRGEIVKDKKISAAETTTSAINDVANNPDHDASDRSGPHRPKLALYIPPSGRYSANFRSGNN